MMWSRRVFPTKMIALMLRPEHLAVRFHPLRLRNTKEVKLTHQNQ